MVEIDYVGYNNANVKVEKMQPLKCMKKDWCFQSFMTL
jgi:hypothetical protein